MTTYVRERYSRSAAVTDPQLRRELSAIERGIPHPTILDLRDFGVRGNNATNDMPAIRKAYAELAAAAAASLVPAVIRWPRATYRLADVDTITAPANSITDLGGSTLNVVSLAASSDVVFDMESASVLTNGTVALTAGSSPSSGEQSIPIRIGRYTDITSGRERVSLSNLTVNGTAMWDNSNAIGIFGDSHNIDIRNVRIRGGDKIGRGIMAHWSAADPSDPDTTTHPHGITIDGVRFEDMIAQADTGVVFLSACYGVSIRNVTGIDCRVLLQLYAGDYGASCADAAIAPLIGRGVEVSAVTGQNTTLGVRVIGRPTISGDDLPMASTFRQLALGGRTDLTPFQPGVFCQYVNGVTLEDCHVNGFLHGLSLGEGADNVTVQGGIWENNQEVGLRVSNGTAKPRGFRAIGATVRNNNVAGASGDDRAGINIANTIDARIEHCVLGAAADETQLYGVRAASTSVRPKLLHNHCMGHASGGVAFSVGSSTDYDIWATGEGNTGEPGVTLRGGAPLYVFTDAGAATHVPIRRYASSAAPAAGTWNRGDRIDRSDPSAAGDSGWIVTTGGTFGTLSSVTGSISTGTASLVVNDASNLAVGQYITIVGVSGVKRITLIVGTTVTLHDNADATVSDAAVAWSAPVLKEYGVIDA